MQRYLISRTKNVQDLCKVSSTVSYPFHQSDWESLQGEFTVYLLVRNVGPCYYGLVPVLVNFNYVLVVVRRAAGLYLPLVKVGTY